MCVFLGVNRRDSEYSDNHQSHSDRLSQSLNSDPEPVIAVISNSIRYPRPHSACAIRVLRCAVTLDFPGRSKGGVAKSVWETHFSAALSCGKVAERGCRAVGRGGVIR
jgi:hypothetical protein